MWQVLVPSGTTGMGGASLLHAAVHCMHSRAHLLMTTPCCSLLDCFIWSLTCAALRCRCQVIDRILYKLDELVRPFVHKILVVIEPLLIDEDYYARVEGREIIANLSKAAGLATMIAAMRPDIDNIDECARAPPACPGLSPVVLSSTAVNCRADPSRAHVHTA